MKTKKKVIRLTESDLHRIIAKSVKNVLNESVWYGDVKPFETIIYACNEILNKFEYVNNDNYEDWSDCDGNDLKPYIYKWAVRVKEEAERYIDSNSQNAPIGANEGW